MDNLAFENLRIAADRAESGAVRLRWTGKSDSRDPGKALGPYFATALQAAKASGAHVEMHFEQLDYFNSSTISALIQLINQAQAQSVSLVLHYDPKLRWQSLSFEALRRATSVFKPASGPPPVQFVESPRS
jgi:hypothetical protein